MIDIIKVSNNSELREFVMFPFKLYKGSKYWVPPIIEQEMNSFNKDLNPNLKNSDVELYMASKNNEIVGRIAVIINWFEVNEQKTSKIRFGWFDFIDDFDISKVLLDKVVESGSKNKLKYMEGPMGFSNLDKVGVLTSGFEIIGTMITAYNHGYYVNHYEKYGLITEKNFHEKTFMFKEIDTAYYEKMSRIVKTRNKLSEVNFTSTNEVMKRTNDMFDLFNRSYAKLSSFVKINQEQKEFMKEKYIKFINPEYIKFVENENKEIVAFAIIMPSFAKALQRMNGKLFPFGFLNLLWAKKFNKDVTLYLIGIDPNYQKLGVTAIIFNSFIQTLKGKGIQICRRTPELTDNISIDKIWKNFNPKLIKTRSTYKLNLN